MCPTLRELYVKSVYTEKMERNQEIKLTCFTAYCQSRFTWVQYNFIQCDYDYTGIAHAYVSML